MTLRTHASPSAGIGGYASLLCPMRLTRLLGTLFILSFSSAPADAPKASPWAFAMPAGADPSHATSDAIASPPPSTAAKNRAAALALYYKAHRLEEETDDDDSALALYLQAASLDPASPLLTQRLIALYTRTGQLNDALSLLEKNVARSPKDPAPLLALARFLEKNHAEAPEQKLRALRTAESAVAKFPSSAAAVDHLVRLHLADQQREKAQATIDAALRSPSTDPAYWLALAGPARNAYPLDDRDTYEKHYQIVSAGVEKALTLAPTDPDLQEAAGDFFARHRQPARALAFYEKATAQRPGDLKTRQKLGQLLRMADRTLEAIALFESLVSIDPTDTISHKALISLYEKIDPSKALTHRADLLRLANGDPRDYATTTTELLQAQRPTEALTLIKRGVFFHPDAPALLALQARVLIEKADLPAALASFAAAESLAKDRLPTLLDPTFYFTWATTASQAQRPAEAEARFRLSIQKTPKDHPELAAPAYHALASLWLSQNKNLDPAGDLLRTANDLVPDYPDYLATLGWWSFQKKDYLNALKHLRRAVALAKPNAPKEMLEHLVIVEAAVGKPAPSLPAK